MVRLDAREHYLWQTELPAAAGPTLLQDDDITAVENVTGADDAMCGGLAEVNARATHGGHVKRYMLSNTRSNAELVLARPNREEGVRAEKPVLTEEIVLEQVAFEHSAQMVSEERVNSAALEQVIEARAALRRGTLEGVRVASSDSERAVDALGGVRRKGVATRVMRQPEYMDLDEDTAVDDADVFTQERP